MQWNAMEKVMSIITSQILLMDSPKAWKCTYLENKDMAKIIFFKGTTNWKLIQKILFSRILTADYLLQKKNFLGKLFIEKK